MIPKDKNQGVKISEIITKNTEILSRKKMEKIEHM